MDGRDVARATQVDVFRAIRLTDYTDAGAGDASPARSGPRRTELDRAKQLYEGVAIALKQYQTAEFNLRHAESRLKSAQDSGAQLPALLSQRPRAPRPVPLSGPLH